MAIIMRKLKRITSVILSAVLLMSVCYASLSVISSANGSTGYSVEYINETEQSKVMTDEQLAELGTSLIAGKRADPYAYDKATDTHKTLIGNSAKKENLNDPDTNLERLTDSLTAKCTDLYYWGGAVIPSVDLEYDLGSSCTVEKFLLLSTSNIGMSAYYTGAYDVYLSEEKDGLYKEENKIYSFDWTKEGIKRGQLVTFKEPQKGRYLAVRILSTSTTATQYNQARISEIAVYGTVGKTEYTVEYINETDQSKLMTNAQLAELGTSLISKKRADPYAYDKDTDTHKTLLGNSNSKENLADADANLNSMTDGKVAREVAGEKVAADLYYNNTGAPIPAIDLEYDMGSACVVEKFLLLGMGQVNAPYYTGAYDVYLSANKDDLYKPENKIYSYNWEKEGAKRGQIVTFTEPKKGRYIAIRILKTYTTASSYNYARISEIAVYGYDTTNYTVQHIAEKESDYKTPNMFSNEQFAALGDDLIKDVKPMMRSNGVLDRTLNDYTGNKLNDGDVENGFNINVWRKATYGESYMDVIYDLGEDPMEIEKFFFLGFCAPWRHYYTGRYQVFIAEEFDDLFLDNNMVYEYDYRNQQISRGQIVTFKKAPVGCYVAVRIIEPNIVEFDNYPNDAWVCPKLSEIAVYGKKAVFEEVPINLAQAKPVNAYLTDASGKATEISEKLFGADESAMLTDGDLTKDVTFKTSKQRLDIVYNLCRDMNVDKIKLSSAAGPGDYTVYAASDYNDIWKESSKLENGDNAEISFEKSRSMRYVRISFTGKNETVKISEIEIIGLNRQQLKYKNLSRSVLTSGIQVFTENFKTGEKGYLEIDPESSSKLFDSDTSFPVALEGGDPAKDSINLLVYLGDLKIVDSIELDFFKRISQYQPGALSLYLGENEDDVLGENAKPICSWDYSADNYKVGLKPRLARYLRVSVTKYAPDDYDGYCVAFTEIRINGSAVTGTQTDRNNDVLLSFKDKATGIEWDILRFDTNDILTGISDSYLKAVDVNNAQKASLYESLYKIQNGKAYQIKFADRNGKEINALGDRSIRIKVPSSAIPSVDETLIGKVADNSTVQLCETLVSDDNSPYIYVEWDKETAGGFTLALPTTADDSYWKGLIKLDNNDADNGNSGNSVIDNSDDNSGYDNTDSTTDGDEEESDNNTDENKQTANRVKKHRRVAYIEEGFEAWVLPVIIGSCVLGAAVIAFVIILIVKKRKKKKTA